MVKISVGFLIATMHPDEPLILRTYDLLPELYAELVSGKYINFIEQLW
jgi:hypothetical protein